MLIDKTVDFWISINEEKIYDKGFTGFSYLMLTGCVMCWHFWGAKWAAKVWITGRIFVPYQNGKKESLGDISVFCLSVRLPLHVTGE